MALLITSPFQWVKTLLTRRWPIGLLVWALIGLSGAEVEAQPSPSREYQIKAVFLFNFLQFVEWPESAFPDKTSPINIGILGNDRFGSALDETVRGETIEGRPLSITRSQRVDDLLRCHLVFISDSEARRVETILAPLASRPVLTVSDMTNFARQGGVIGFYPEGKKVRFEINVNTAQRSGLKISSDLLRLGKIVGADTAGGQLR